MDRSPSEAELNLAATLADCELTARGFLANASNHTLLVQVGGRTQGLHAVYKPRAGERTLWDFPAGTLCQREVAAYAVSRFLGWDVVPVTVLRDGPMGVGSVQAFIPHDPRLHYFQLISDERWLPELTRIAAFDLLINNADRKASHVLVSEDDGRLRGIDHGVTFHPQIKLRTVIWDLGAAPIERSWQADFRRLAAALGDGASALCAELGVLLSAAELQVLRLRAEALADAEALPDVPEDRRPYPWPPL